MSNPRSRGIRVAGQINFKRRRWRDGITFYLHAMWRGDREIMGKPIKIGDIRLWLDLLTGTYRACYHECGPSDQVLLESPPDHFKAEQMLRCGPSRIEVEQGLIRFSRDDSIRMLTISVEGSGVVFLWKLKGVRGDYGISGHQLDSDPLLSAPEEGEGLSKE